MDSIHGKTDDGLLQLIAFRIAQQDYCFDIKRVREIRGWTPATPLPCAPPVMLGVINLRGTVIPVIDLSARMGFGTTTPCSRHAILVVEVRNQWVGLLVEAVSEILTIEKSAVQPTPSVGASCVDRLVAGVISNADRIVTVLALDQVADFDGIQSLMKTSTTVVSGAVLLQDGKGLASGPTHSHSLG